MAWALEISKPAPLNTPPPTRPHLLMLLKHFHQLGTKCSNTWAYRAIFIQITTCVLVTHITVISFPTNSLLLCWHDCIYQSKDLLKTQFSRLATLVKTVKGFSLVIMKIQNFLVLFLFSFFQTAFLCVVSLDVLELTLQTRVALNSQKYVCLCFLSVEIKGMFHHAQQKFRFLICTSRPKIN